MKTKIANAKAKFAKHKTEFVYSAGVVTGIVIAMYTVRKTPGDIIAPISSAQLQHLIDNPEDALEWIAPRQSKVTLFNDVLLKD